FPAPVPPPEEDHGGTARRAEQGVAGCGQLPRGEPGGGADGLDDRPDAPGRDPGLGPAAHDVDDVRQRRARGQRAAPDADYRLHGPAAFRGPAAFTGVAVFTGLALLTERPPSWTARRCRLPR